MNKKGFTLTELLATIAIIAIVSLIGTVSLTGIKAKIDENMFDSKLQLALGAAQNWGQDNKETVVKPPNSKKVTKTIDGKSITGYKITIKDLIESNYLTADEENKFNDNNGVDVKNATFFVYKNNNRIYTCLNTYPNKPSKTVAQRYACQGVTL